MMPPEPERDDIELDDDALAQAAGGGITLISAPSLGPNHPTNTTLYW